MMKYILLLCGLFVHLGNISAKSFAVSGDTVRFINPFVHPITFSGNFGELRANHFHGGLDFKTEGVTGKPVHALADGYISRIRVTHGSGYVLDVVYNNGYSTINHHLEAFVGDIARRVEDLQYEQESWEVEIVPEVGEYPVKRGQVIAYSGNTGYSFGPHLHLDVIETATNDYVDPLPFFAGQVKDHTAPQAQGLMLFPQRGRGVVNGKTTRQAFALNQTAGINAWGEIGAGICAYDYMDGVHNRYGVHTVILEVDGQEVFRSVVDRFAYDENRYINSWTYGQYMKSFIDPGNRLRLLHASNGNRGLVTIDEERPYHFVYTLRDALGNESKVHFTIQGLRSSISEVEHREKYHFRWDRVNYLQEPGFELVLPRGVLYEDAYLNYAVRGDSGDIAFTYQLNDCNIPLHKTCNLRIGLRRRPLADSTKYYVAGVSAKGSKYNMGGRYVDGYMEVKVRDLTTYTVAIDTVPPVLTPVGQASWGRTGRIVFKVKDAQTDIISYRGTIDGQYALFGKLNSVKDELVCRLNPHRVKRGGSHVLVMSVTDACGNVTTRQYRFVW